MAACDVFQLARAGDDLTYVFVRSPDSWRRTDREDIVIKRAADGGWICTDESGERLGWPEQCEKAGAEPPEGSWRSKKGDKSYMYQMTYIGQTALSEEYLKQDALRAWDDMLRHPEATVGAFKGLHYDFGCGAGPISKRLAAMPAVKVIGVDLDPNMVACAKLECPTQSSFRRASLDALAQFPGPWEQASGVWSSFVVAYIPSPKLLAALTDWAAKVRPGGWLCLVEIDGLFSAHGPMEQEWEEGFHALDASFETVLGYDCFAGRKMRGACEACGLDVIDEQDWPDSELYFDGPAGDHQLAAWTARLQRPGISRAFEQCFQEKAEQARARFLDCLRSPAHRAKGSSRMVICRTPASSHH